jgi:hypothetical protein
VSNRCDQSVGETSCSWLQSAWAILEWCALITASLNSAMIRQFTPTVIGRQERWAEADSDLLDRELQRIRQEQLRVQLAWAMGSEGSIQIPELKPMWNLHLWSTESCGFHIGLSLVLHGLVPKDHQRPGHRMSSEEWQAQSQPQAVRPRQLHLPKQVVVQETHCECSGAERLDHLAILLSEALSRWSGQLQPAEPNWCDGPPSSRGSNCRFKWLPSLMTEAGE